MAIDKELLRQRKWPVPNFPIGQEVLDRTEPDNPDAICDDNGMPLLPRPGYTYSGKEWPKDYVSSNFIPEARLASCPLADIPFGSCAVKKLSFCGKNIWGIAGNENETWLFSVAEKSISGVQKISGSAAPKALGCKDEEPAVLLSNGTLCNGKGAELLQLPGSVINADACGSVFGGLLDNGKLFLADLKNNTVKTADVPVKGEVSAAFGIGENVMYGVCGYGEIFFFDGEKAVLTGCRMPGFAGRAVYNQAGALLLDQERNLLWGGSSEDGVLFAFDIAGNCVRSYGKMLPGRGIQALALDGNKLYGIGTQNCCRIFSRDLTTGEVIDHGMINQSVPRTWCLYEAYTLLIPAPGVLLLGEAERISHLFWVNMNTGK